MSTDNLPSELMLYERATKWLSRRPHSHAETQGYLMQITHYRSVGDEQIREILSTRIQVVLAKLTQHHFLNDAVFAQWLIASRMRRSPRGQRLLKAELARKGVPVAIMEEALAQSHTTHDEDVEIATIVARARLRKRSVLDKKELGRLSAHLARRGFSWDIIRTVIDRVAGKTLQ